MDFKTWKLRVSTKFSTCTCSFCNKGLKEYLVKHFILFVAYFKQTSMHLNPEAFVLVCCICLNLFDEPLMDIDIVNSL